jgi:hypothetical protein
VSDWRGKWLVGHCDWQSEIAAHHGVFTFPSLLCRDSRKNGAKVPCSETGSMAITGGHAVRVLLSPPRSPARTEISRSPVSSPVFAGVFAVVTTGLSSLSVGTAAYRPKSLPGLCPRQTFSRLRLGWDDSATRDSQSGAEIVPIARPKRRPVSGSRKPFLGKFYPHGRRRVRMSTETTSIGIFSLLYYGRFG